MKHFREISLYSERKSSMRQTGHTACNYSTIATTESLRWDLSKSAVKSAAPGLNCVGATAVEHFESHGLIRQLDNNSETNI